MPVKIPWESIGPYASILIVVLVVVFAFILKFNKQNKTVINNSLPKPTDTLSKKTLCFGHESRISSNTTMIGEMKKQQEIQRKENRQDHKDMFNKIDDMGTKIIQEISKNSSQ